MIPSLWEVVVLKKNLQKELTPLNSKFNHKPLNTKRKSYKKDLEDLLVVLQSSKLEDPQKLKYKNRKTESRMLSVLQELPVMKVLFQVVEQPYCMLARNLTKLKDQTSIKILE